MKIYTAAYLKGKLNVRKSEFIGLFGTLPNIQDGAFSKSFPS